MTRDVAIVGDGPAGSALAAACVRAGLDAVLVGPDRPWTSILAAWADELPAGLAALVPPTPGSPSAPLAGGIDVVARRRHHIDRAYGALDLAVLRSTLREPLAAGRHLVDAVDRVWHTTSGSRVRTAGGEEVAARLVVDATGAASALRPHATRARAATAWQTAYGLVLDHRPDALDGEGAVLMDWRNPGGDPSGPPTFLYVLPLGAGRWLVEETALRASPAVPPEALRARLAARLGSDLTDAAEHVEHVAIPMAPGIPSRSDPVVGFGAAARYVHPATGYSVSASLRAADRVAGAIAGVARSFSDPRRHALVAWNAVWPAAHRRTRSLHDVGAAALARMSPDEVVDFFDAFFALPAPVWSAYLRIDATPGQVAGAMRAAFSSVPWALRRRLAGSLPVPILRSLR